jgi:hypothetical protein
MNEGENHDRTADECQRERDAHADDLGLDGAAVREKPGELCEVDAALVCVERVQSLDLGGGFLVRRDDLFDGDPECWIRGDLVDRSRVRKVDTDNRIDVLRQGLYVHWEIK